MRGTRTPGSAGSLRKRSGRKAATAPGADPTWPTARWTTPPRLLQRTLGSSTTPTPPDGSWTPAGRCSKPPTASQTNRAERSKRSGPPAASCGAYTLKEALRAIFKSGLTLQDVTILIDRFISKALPSRPGPFIRLEKTIHRHRDVSSKRSDWPSTKVAPQALNNKIRLITRRAYGLHSAVAALALIMLTCGPITVQPRHKPQA